MDVRNALLGWRPHCAVVKMTGLGRQSIVRDCMLPACGRFVEVFVSSFGSLFSLKVVEVIKATLVDAATHSLVGLVIVFKGRVVL